MDQSGTGGRAHASRRPPRRERVGPVIVAVVLALLAAAPGRAAAGTGPRPAQADTAPTVRLARQAPWVPMGFELEVAVSVDAPPDATVTLSVHTRVDDRDELLALIGGEPPGTVLGRRRFELRETPRDRSGARVLSIGTQLPGAPPDDDLVAFERTGVYPVTVTVETSAGSQASLTTFATMVDVASPPARLPVALAVPVHAAPATLPDGTFDPAVVTELRAGGRLDRIVDELAGTDTPVSISLGPETVASWAAIAREDASTAGGFDALRAATGGGREVLASPYVRLDMPTLTSHGLGEEIPTQLRAGAETLAEVLGVRADPRQVVVDPVDSASLRALRDGLFVDRVVVPEPSVEGVAAAGARAGTYVLDVTADPLTPTTFTAALADPLYPTLASVGGETPLRTQRLLAALAVDATSDPRSQGAVVTFPHDWSPETGFLARLLQGMGDHPLLAPVTIGDWFDRVPAAVDGAGEEVVVRLRSIDTGTPAVTSSQLDQARHELSGLRSLVGPDPSTTEGAAAILRAPSADFTGSTGEARVEADLARISQDAATFLDQISTEDKTVTITGDRATIPVTLHNETGRPVRVRLQVASSKLLFPEGPERVVELPPGTSTEQVPVEARASGTFPMAVSLTTADGVFEIGATRTITIRTTVFSGVAGWISAGAALFLGIWWLSHAVRARRRAPGAPA